MVQWGRGQEVRRGRALENDGRHHERGVAGGAAAPTPTPAPAPAFVRPRARARDARIRARVRHNLNERLIDWNGSIVWSG